MGDVLTSAIKILELKAEKHFPGLLDIATEVQSFEESGVRGLKQKYNTLLDGLTDLREVDCQAAIDVVRANKHLRDTMTDRGTVPL